MIKYNPSVIINFFLFWDIFLDAFEAMLKNKVIAMSIWTGFFFF